MDTSDNQTDLFGEKIDATVQEVLQHIDGLELDDMKLIYAQRLMEFYELHTHVIEKVMGITGEQNHKLSAALVAAIGNHFGGVSFYLPHNERLSRFIRDIHIYKAFTGNNLVEVCKRFKVSHQTVYTAVAKQRDLRQRKLPF